VRDDERFMRRALELARNGLGLAAPNPMVGAVVVAADGAVAGEGWHEGPGTPHAEVVALRAAGPRARGSLLYTTLEPCAHIGRTPPCAPFIVKAGVAEVIGGSPDPNPLAAGGFDLLRRSGVRVSVGTLAGECGALIAGFAKHVRTGLPFVTLKMASSLDGKVAARDGSSRWVTGPAAREDAHRLRAGSGAVVVACGTAVNDRPALTVRLSGYRGRQPLRVLVDGRGRTPAEGPLFERTAPTLVATTMAAPDAARTAWERAGAEVSVLDESAPGRVALPALFDLLGKRDVQDVLLEGGPRLAWSAVEADLVDRFVLYLAPKLIGGEDAPGILIGAGVPSIGDALPVSIVSVERVGEDVKVVAERDVHRDR